MENPIFPYGPSPKKLEKLVTSLSKFTDKKVDLDLLEKLGVPKTQVSIALSGLKQLGFVNSNAVVTDLCKKFSNKNSRSQACETVVKEVYKSLIDVVEKNPTAAQVACTSYLQRLGRGDSAREKILKLFWFFWTESGRKLEKAHLDFTEVPNNVAVESISMETIDLLISKQQCMENSPLVNRNKESNALSTIFETDSAALQLAYSLINYCESREEILTKKRKLMVSLQNECTQIEDELQRVKETLEKHLLTYPEIVSLIKSNEK